MGCWLALLLTDRLCTGMVALESLRGGLRALQMLQAELIVLLVRQRCSLSFLEELAPLLAAVLACKLCRRFLTPRDARVRLRGYKAASLADDAVRDMPLGPQDEL